MNTRLSVNINKIAVLRNSRGGHEPDVLKAAIDCQRFGADGITVHPRPDERHIRYSDVVALKPLIITEFNIEGNPKEDKFVRLVMDTRPEQVTLVPDSVNQLTSNHGWDTNKELEFLRDIIQTFKNAGIRVSLFVDPCPEMVAGAAQTGADRVELYTEAYAAGYAADRENAIRPYVQAALEAKNQGLGLNAGHDLSLNNISFFAREIPGLLEVSIGHAFVSESLYLGMENVTQLYKRRLTAM